MTKTKTKWAAGAAMALVVAAGSAVPAMAQDTDYDGYCYTKQNNAKTTGTVVGAVAGGALGSQVSKNERGLGAVAGAVIGGVVGRNIGKNSVKCLNGEYYSYQNGYYSPASAPDGYDVAYFRERPNSSTYTTTYYDREARSTSPYDRYAYNSSYNNNSSSYGQSGYNSNRYSSTTYRTEGFRDERGTWREGRPVAFGWKDENGRWHEGSVQAYGYRDSNGRWRETSSATAYNNGY